MKNETAILESLVKLMATLNMPGAMDRGTLILLYQNSREMGQKEGEKLDTAEKLSTALDIIRQSSWGKVWNIELWRDQGQPEDTFIKDGQQCAWLIWRECPVREVCRSEGVEQDGVLCHISYRLFSGMLSMVMNEKIDITPVNVGPNACKKIAVWR